MNEFKFYLNGFRTKYLAIPGEQCYAIYATSRDGNKEFTGIHYEHGELKSMMERGVIVKAYEEEENEAA